MENHLINTFLYFGYSINKEYRLPFDKKILSERKLNSHSESDLINMGSNILKNVFKVETNEINKDRTIVIPLSGGLDSRAILAGLLDNGLKNQIVTVSFGTPGTWDYDIALKVAKFARVTHRKIDLTKVEISTKTLLNTMHMFPNSRWKILIDLFYNRLVNEHFGKNAIYWSGFMGGELAGTHISHKNVSFEMTKKQFISKNRMPQLLISNPSFKPLTALPEKPLLKPILLSFSDQLDFGIRQFQYIKPTIINSEFDYKIPFLNEDWVNFILKVPRRHRINCCLYKRVLLKTWPKFFQMPTRNNLGLPLAVSKFRFNLNMLFQSLLNRFRNSFPQLVWPLNPGFNYIDFNEAIRKKTNYHHMVKTNLKDLKDRNIVYWLNIDELWNNHMRRKKNLAWDLLLLTVLEINLKIHDHR